MPLVYMNYDHAQLENIAERHLREFDSERLTTPKKVDAIGFVEFYLNLQFDPQRLSPYQQILGLTSFNDGCWYVWPEGYVVDPPLKRAFMDNDTRLEQELPLFGPPKPHPVNKGTVMVDDRLFDKGANEGRANFTVLHEAFHWILHPKVFARQPVLLQRYCDQQALSTFSMRKGMTGIQKTEYQANAAAAAFLMPRDAVRAAFCAVMKLSTQYKFPIPWTAEIDTATCVISEWFGASNAAMRNRLRTLGFVTNVPVELRTAKHH